MKKLIFFVAGALGLLALAAATSPKPVIPGFTQGTALSSFSPAFEVLTDAEQVTLYPGAYNVVTRADPFGGYFPVVSFDSPVSAYELEAFYTTNLEEMGWQVGEPYYSGGVGLHYYWQDKNTNLPWTSDLRVRIESFHAELDFSRIPWATRVPIFPASTEVTSDDVLDEYGFYDRLTTFVTNATASEIEQYYVQLLPQYGWEPGWGSDIPLGNISTGLVFGYDIGGPEAMSWGRITITVIKLDRKGTHVQIKAEGTDLPDPRVK